MRAFTLIDILVSLVVIAVMLGLLLPTVARARDATRSVVCRSNLHQISLAARIYVDDYHYLPVLNDFPTTLAAWDLPAPIFKCPADSSDTPSSYLYAALFLMWDTSCNPPVFRDGRFAQPIYDRDPSRPLYLELLYSHPGPTAYQAAYSTSITRRR